MKRQSVWFAGVALLAVTRFAAAGRESTISTGGSSTLSIDGKTVIVHTGDGGGGGGGAGPLFGSAGPSRSIRVNFRPDAGKMEKGSFLGITASPVTGALRSQLKLQQGVGLVVESVEKDSPADTAGVEQYDVLQQFNDQLLIDPKQFGVLVRLAKPGDEVTLKVLRKGDTMTVKAKLVERDLSPLEGDDPWGLNRQLLSIDREAGRADQSIKNALELLHHGSGSGSFSYADKGMTLQINQQDGDRHLTAKDASGKVLFDGPINTEEQKKGLPPEVAKRMKEMEPTTKPKSDE